MKSKTYDYVYADKILKVLKKKFVMDFSTLKSQVADFDELNILHSVSKTYDKMDTYTMRYFEKIYYHYYSQFNEDNPILVGKSTKEKSKIVNDKSKRAVKKWVKSYAPITAYVFLNEVQRKRDRLEEGLISTKRMQEIDRALKSWWVQVNQGVISITDLAIIQGAKDCGYTQAKWITQEDEKVCKECNALDKKVFDIDKIPNKPHYNCRCTLEFIKGK